MSFLPLASASSIAVFVKARAGGLNNYDLGEPDLVILGLEMKRSGSPMLLSESLDLRPLHSILWKDLHLEGAGRPVEYDPECDLRALMLRQLEQIPYVKDLVKQLRRNKDMRSACGYHSKVPTEAHFSQMKTRIGVEGFQAIEAWLRHEALRLRKSQPLSAVGLVQAACIDGTDFPAWSSRDPLTHAKVWATQTQG